MVGPPPLTGLKVLEFAGLAPGPFAGLLLADAGASVLRIDRASFSSSSSSSSPSSPPPANPDLLTRHKASVAVDLKTPGGAALVKCLARAADVVIDPFRPGVLERLGLGPAELCAANPRLVYARVTGFRPGPDSKYRDRAGHDINYLAVSGVLAMLGRAGQKPTPPLNMLADFAGGGVALVLGILLALVSRATTGRGQVVEANMVDGSSYLATYSRLGLKTSLMARPRGENLLDSGCPFYDTYETLDAGRYVAVGALEPRFFAALLRGLGLQSHEDRGWEARRHDPASWPELRALFARLFAARTRDEWEAVFDGTDACCTPVLTYAELEAGREGDQRPVVTLRETPLLAVRRGASDPSHGQGPGVEGEAYVAYPLAPGEGGAERLKEWLGWSQGVDFDVQGQGLVLKDKIRSKM